MFASRGATLGSGGVSDGCEGGSKGPRMTDSNPCLAVSSGGDSGRGSGSGSFQPCNYCSGSFQPSNFGSGSFQPTNFGSGSFQPPNFGGGGIHLAPAFPVVRLRGLPFNCTDMDIFKFFSGLDIVDVLLVNKSGRFAGEAVVVFAGPAQVGFALQRDRQSMGHRYVEVFRCRREDYYAAVAAEVNYEGIYDNHFRASPSRATKRKLDDRDQLEYTRILRMRGLPYNVSASQIIEFFNGFDVAEGDVHLACRPDGKATGEAYVAFVSAEEAKRAMSRDKMTIGPRYVELFPAADDEARRAQFRSRE